MSRNTERFEHVRANVGTMLDEGGIQAYLQRLATYNVDTDEYLTWSLGQPASQVEKNEPAMVLGMIQENSLTDLNAAMDLGIALSNVVGNVILLAQDNTRRFLVGSDSSALSLGRYKPIDDDDGHGDGGVRITAAPTDPVESSHPLVVKLSALDSSSRAEPFLQPSTIHKLPRYAVPLGRLLIHDIRNIDDIPTDEQPTTEFDPYDRPMLTTNYAVVMDAASKARSIWLVYNRAPIDMEAGCQIESAPTDEDQIVLFPPHKNFDIAMIMPDVQMWKLGTAVLALDSVAGFVATTRSSKPVLAVAALRSEVDSALRN